MRSGLVLDSSCLSGMTSFNKSGLPSSVDKRRGVKMGTRVFSNARRVSRSMEAVNTLTNDELEQLSLQSVSLHCSTASIASPIIGQNRISEVYVLGKLITVLYLNIAILCILL